MIDDPAPVFSGSEKLVEVFGRWPSFHDAEVLEMRLSRQEGDEFGWVVLRARVHLFEGRATAEGGFRFFHHTIATLRFEDVHDLRLSGFNHQNVIYDLFLDRESDGFLVEFHPSYGVSCEFRCRSMAVTDAEPGIPPGSLYEG